jgi:hypothetical protein
MSQTVCAICGLAFSGKSSAARGIVRELGADLISLAAINDKRGLDGGKGVTDAQWEETNFMAMSAWPRLCGAGAPSSWTTRSRTASFATAAGALPRTTDAGL